ncbi:MAG TPA: thioredoxin domain-containing protein [Longimicrobium sp.]|nr:thioredoxin domain-containing protein [Longimicrobium sp.]
MMKKEWLANLAAALLVLCALTMTALVVQQKLFSNPTTEPERVYVDGWEAYGSAGQAMGPAGAPVTIVEFSDFQCSACRALAVTMRGVRERHPEQVRVVYRHFPLRSHPHAIAAARASECAAAQGRFEAFHNALYALQDSIGTRSWLRYAATADVPDLSAFQRCAEQDSDVEALHRDTIAARGLAVTGTPTLLINGWRVHGAPPAEVLDKMVRDALRAAN